jgi:hypothetical protein
MPDAAVPLESTPPLSQPMRVIDTFVAPSKTFTDILRNANCWLALVIIVVMSFGYAAVIDKTVGYDTVSQVQMAKSPAQAERMEQMPPDQRANALALGVKITRYVTYGSWVFVVILLLIEALIFWAAFNFGLGAKTRFPQVFAVMAFSALPRTIFVLGLSMVLLFAGVGTESFDVQNPVGTNVGYYLTEAPKWLQTGGRFLDVFGLWSLALMVIGMAIISKKKTSSSAMVVVGVWLLVVLISVGATAAFS